MNFRREFYNAGRGRGTTGTIARNSLGQQAFHRMMTLERRRAERSHKSFLLMLLDVTEQAIKREEALILNKKVMFALTPITRETDIIGWYKENSVVGLVFTEITGEDLSSVTAIMNRVSKTLKTHLSPSEFSGINLSFRLLPEAHEEKSSPLSASSLAIAALSTAGGAGSAF